MIVVCLYVGLLDFTGLSSSIVGIANIGSILVWNTDAFVAFFTCLVTELFVDLLLCIEHLIFKKVVDLSFLVLMLGSSMVWFLWDWVSFCLKYFVEFWIWTWELKFVIMLVSSCNCCLIIMFSVDTGMV